MKSSSIVLALSVFAVLADAGEATPTLTANTQAGPLDPAQLQVIQGIGQAVLAARQADGPSTVAATLSAQLADLRASLQAAEIAVVKSSATLTAVGLASSKGETVDIDLTLANRPIQLHRTADGHLEAEPERSDHRERARMSLTVQSAETSRTAESAAVLTESHARVVALRQHLAATPVVGTDRDAPVVAAASGLLDEAEKVLAAGTQVHVGEIRRVRELLASKTLNEVLAERDAASREPGAKPAEPTPTISTLIRHR